MIDTVFFDLGGVLLSKGWDREFRREAAIEFQLDAGFEARHEKLAKVFECGQLSLDDYLGRVVFNQAREFTKTQFVDFIHHKQTPMADSLAVLKELRKTVVGGHHLLLCTLNNESRELNEYRIERFGLRDHFRAFFSSCYLGHMKPDAPIYRSALDIAQRHPGECLFIDDTAANLDAAQSLGMDTIHFQDAAQLRAELHRRGLISSAPTGGDTSS